MTFPSPDNPNTDTPACEDRVRALMAKLEESVREAKAARNRKLAADKEASDGLA